MRVQEYEGKGTGREKGEKQQGDFGGHKSDFANGAGGELEVKKKEGLNHMCG